MTRAERSLGWCNQRKPKGITSVIRQIKLGLSIRFAGYHAVAWRHYDAAPGAVSEFVHFSRVARTAEAAKFDMLFPADGIGIRATGRALLRRSRGAIGGALLSSQSFAEPAARGVVG